MDRKEKIKNFKKSQNPDKPKKKIALKLEKIEKTEKPGSSVTGDLIGGGILITIAAFIFKAALKGAQK